MAKYRKYLFYIMFIVLIIRVGYTIYLYNYKYTTWKNKVITVDIIDVQKISEEGITYVVKYNKDKFLLYVKDLVNVYEYGDRLKILSSNYEIKKYNNPYEFNYKRYLNSNGYISRIYCTKVLEKTNREEDFFTSIYDIRKLISDKLVNSMTFQKANFLKSIIYGDDINLDENIENNFIDAGIGHMLCISGTHIIFLIKAFEKITKEERNRILKIMLLIWFYILSLFKISILRAIIMYILSSFKSKLHFKEKFFLTLYIVLCINPLYIFNIGVIFSFLSVFSINLFNNTIYSWFYIKLKSKSKVLNWIITNLAVTLSSQILILPFQIYYFQKITVLSIISNLIITGIFNVLMFFSFSLYIIFFIPFVSDITLTICNFLVGLTLEIVDKIAKFSFLNIELPKINIMFFISYYLIIFLKIYGKKVILISWKNRKNLKRAVRYIKIICYGYMLSWYIVTMYFESYVIFFNVGQGNMALIHKNSTNILIDIGSKNNSLAANTIISFLKAKNIKYIDCIAITHMHTDHYNGIFELIESDILLNCILISKPYENDEEYNLLIRKIKEKGIGVIQVEEQDEIKINDIEINVLSPPKDKYIKDEDMLNANSNVYLISLKNKKLLFMGDATKNTESYIIKTEKIKEKLNNIDVLQVAHHGSDTSSSEEFLKNINSCIAVISAQKDIYGHPSDNVVELLEKLNFKVRITEKEGAIII